MKQKTLLLFQLFLAVFAFYAVLKYSGNLRLCVPLACLLGMFCIGKLESRLAGVSSPDQGQEERSPEEAPKGAVFKPLQCLLRSKNILLLVDSIHYVLQDLGVKVSRSPNHRGIDRLVNVPGTQMTFGLKVLANVGEVDESWDMWEEAANFDLGRGGKRRLVLIGSNSSQAGDDSQHRFHDFPAAAEKLLSSKGVVAMTTLTLYQIWLLHKKKRVDPEKIFDLIRRHPGGVFRLEKYAKGAGQAA
jgi:hypothetical protein